MTNAVVPPKAQVSSIVKTILQKTLQNQANWTILDKTDQSCQLILDRTRIKLESAQVDVAAVAMAEALDAR